MAPEEQARLTLYAWMQDTADEEKAEALMASLPPTHWPDLATKNDVALLERQMEALEHKLTSLLHNELRTQTKTFVAWTGGLTVTLAAFFATMTMVAAR